MIMLYILLSYYIKLISTWSYTYIWVYLHFKIFLMSWGWRHHTISSIYSTMPYFYYILYIAQYIAPIVKLDYTFQAFRQSLSCILKQPALTKSASSSSSNNKNGLVAPRDNGKSPRGQDWGPSGTPLRSYNTIQGFGYIYTGSYNMLCYMSYPWVIHEDKVRWAAHMCES